MTREDVKRIFPDATDDQITSFLNQSNSDVAKEKAKAQKAKEQADKAEALEKALEELKKQNMTEAEKAELELP
jgi:F0F1-type ATP synthase membrane subunit b/b'